MKVHRLGVYQVKNTCCDCSQHKITNVHSSVMWFSWAGLIVDFSRKMCKFCNFLPNELTVIHQTYTSRHPADMLFIHSTFIQTDRNVAAHSRQPPLHIQCLAQGHNGTTRVERDSNVRALDHRYCLFAAGQWLLSSVVGFKGDHQHTHVRTLMKQVGSEGL